MQEYDRKVLFNFEHNKTTTKIYFGCLELKHIKRVVDYIKVYVSKLFVCLFFNIYHTSNTYIIIKTAIITTVCGVTVFVMYLIQILLFFCLFVFCFWRCFHEGGTSAFCLLKAKMKTSPTILL